jgi:serine/threonine-protein kinase
VWAGQYNCNLRDFLTTRNEIASEISDKLRLRLSGPEHQQLSRRETANPEAYRHFLLGRHHLSKRTPDELRRAGDEFEQALSLDPRFALAHAGLADTYAILTFMEEQANPGLMLKARAAAERAVSLDNSLAEAHASLGLICYNTWRLGQAEREFKLAIQCNPNFPSAHQWYSITLTALGRRGESLKEMERAHDLDPVSPIIAVNLALTYLSLGQTDLAAKALEKARELDPNFLPLLHGTGLIRWRQQRFDEAIVEFQKALDASGLASRQLGWVGFAYGAAGKTNEARTVLAELDQRFLHSEATAFSLAIVCAGLGETNRAFELLERSLTGQSSTALFADSWFLEPLHADRRFADFLKRAGWPPHTQKGD